MELFQILSKRDINKDHYMQIVYQWENIFAEKLNLKIVCERKPFFNVPKISYAIRHFAQLLFTRKKTLVFVLSAATRTSAYNSKNVVPVIIDFWLSKNQIKDFEKAYSKNPIVLISSKQVYDFLKQNGCKLNIAHFPLSNPDEDVPHSLEFQKNYDVILIGHQNPVINGFFETYKESHPNVSYIYRKTENGKVMIYTSDGKSLGCSIAREMYIDVLRQSKCVFYSTAAIDGVRNYANGFSQVTPRFFENLSCGCNIVMRYQDNPDTRYYEIPQNWENAKDYETFERLLDDAICNPVNCALYKKYL